MTDSSERMLLTHYHLESLNPTEWPAEKDEDDSSDDDHMESKLTPRGSLSAKHSTKPSISSRPGRMKSRYSALQRIPGKRGSLLQPVAQKSKSGSTQTLIQRDEPDPLGGNMSVMATLRMRGYKVEEDSKLRNRFLLASNTFSPTLFLSEVHNSASTEELLYGLDHLQKSIEKKSASLKILVGSNFERFVRAKATIDNVYTEMRKYGVEDQPKPQTFRHSSRISGSFHSRKSSANNPIPSPWLPDTSKKSALLKESEYGIQGIKAPLTDASIKAQEVWGPALGGQEKEERLKSALLSVEKNRNLLHIETSIDEAIKRRDYEAIAEDYERASAYANDAKAMVDRAKQQQVNLDDAQIHQIILTARMWHDVEMRVQDFKRDIWRQLSETHFIKRETQGENRSEEYMELISVLLQLGVEDNPIWIWLLSRYDYLKTTISQACERARIEIEIARRKLSISEKPSLTLLAKYLKMALNPEPDFSGMDSPEVLQFWELVHSFLQGLLSMQGSLLSEVMEFWDTVQGFVSGKKQRTLPIGIGGQSRKHHRLSNDGVKDLQDGARDLFSLIRSHVYELFGEAPIEDISALFTPIPPTPKTPASAALTPRARYFTFDKDNIPPPSPKTGEKWDTCAFWPPHGNCLSGINYLSKIVNLIGLASAEVAGLDIVQRESRLVDEYKQLIGTVRERSIAVVCATWLIDSENCRQLEDWTRSTEKSDQTNLPSYFHAFESNILSGLQKALYLSDAVSSPGATLVIAPPSQRHVETVQKGLKHSLYKAFSGMMEHAAKPTQSNGQKIDNDANDLTIPAAKMIGKFSAIQSIDATNVNIRKLLTMSNFQAIRSEVVPNLISQFENNFAMTISEDSKQARDVLAQMNARVFQSYVKPTIEKLRNIISSGISSPTWTIEGVRPSDARPYVYEVLLSMVIVHTEVSNTSAPMTGPVLSHLLDNVSNAMIDGFKKRPRYSLVDLMQATLDVEFLAQTLNNYTTEKASGTQSQIYLALDERTDNDARMKLQSELPEMRAILKRLRENTKSEFACFKRSRTPKDR